MNKTLKINGNQYTEITEDQFFDRMRLHKLPVWVSRRGHREPLLCTGFMREGDWMIWVEGQEEAWLHDPEETSARLKCRFWIRYLPHQQSDVLQLAVMQKRIESFELAIKKMREHLAAIHKRLVVTNDVGIVQVRGGENSKELPKWEQLNGAPIAEIFTWTGGYAFAPACLVYELYDLQGKRKEREAIEPRNQEHANEVLARHLNRCETWVREMTQLLAKEE